MSWASFLILTLTALFVLFLTGVPVFAAFLLINLVAVLWLFGDAGFGLFTSSIVGAVTAPSFAALPLFILMGEVLFRTGAADSLFDASDRAMRSVRGRQWALMTLLSAVFGALSGSAVAVAAMLGKSVMPRLVAKGYDETITVSAVLGGASLAPIIPPSLLAIIIGSLTNVSIADLLAAGVLPGLLLGGLVLVYTLGLAYFRQGAAPDETAISAGGAGGAMPILFASAPVAAIIFSVMGLIIFGVATPTEAAAAGVFGAVLTAALRRRLSMYTLQSALMSTARITAMILMIVAASRLFGQLLAFTGATEGVISAVQALNAPPAIVFLLLLAAPFFFCMFVDQLAFLMVAAPIYTPLVALNGFDPVWFWMLFLIMLTIGSITPPFGYTLFALKGANGAVSIERIYAGAWPVVGLCLAGVALMAVAPGIVVFLPNLFAAG